MAARKRTAYPSRNARGRMQLGFRVKDDSTGRAPCASFPPTTFQTEGYLALQPRTLHSDLKMAVKVSRVTRPGAPFLKIGKSTFYTVKRTLGEWISRIVDENQILIRTLRFQRIKLTCSLVYTYLADAWYCFSNARVPGEQKFRRTIENSVSVAVDRNLDIRGTSSKVQFRLSQWKFR